MKKLLILSVFMVSLTACNLSYRGSAEMWTAPITQETNELAASSYVEAQPILPTKEPTAKSLSCSLRVDWPVHIVVRGDTLSGIAVRSNSTVAELAAANCMVNPNLLVEGQHIYVPHTPVSPTFEPHA